MRSHRELIPKRSDPRPGILFAGVFFVKTYYVYIMTNKYNKVLYTGVTNDLLRRVYEHREKTIAGFTLRYNVTKLVYFENHVDPISAIQREKQIKNGSRKRKVQLIERRNPHWIDLYPSLL
jgi:putative endonuclease